MNKLTALHKLASAYHNQFALPADTQDTLDILEEMFGRIRRSLHIDDLAPAPKCIEGFNPKGPTHL